MNDHKFKVGDVVYVQGDGLLTGPCTIEKTHKGNGNVYVNGVQYSVHGTSRGDRVWSYTRLLLDGSPALLAAQRKQRRSRLAAQLSDLGRVAGCGIPDVADLDEVEAAAQALRAALKI